MAFVMIWLIVGIGFFLAVPDRHSETWTGRAIRAAGYGFVISLLVLLLNSVGCSDGSSSGEYRFSS